MDVSLKNSPNILVLGDIMIDEYFVGSVHRMSPEAPVPVVSVSETFYRLGGAGNVVRNLKSLSANVDYIGVIGQCDASVKVKHELLGIGCKTEYLIFDEHKTIPKKSRVLSGTQQLVRYDVEDIVPLKKNIDQKIRELFSVVVEDYDLVILSDYAKGVLSDGLTEFLIRASKKYEVPVLVDPKGSEYSKYDGAYCITPNKKELELMYGADISDFDNLESALDHLELIAGVEVAMVTLSEEGIAYKQDELRISKTKARAIADVTGAGDTVIAALGFCFALGESVPDAVEFANYAAGLVVERPGVATVTRENVLRFKNESEGRYSNKELETDELRFAGEMLRADGKKIVFTNGCFDILHSGHIEYLQASKRLGDVLVVGLNSDTSVRRLKGSSRPINTEQDRLLLVSALSFVDYVTIFDDSTPQNIIELLKPNVITKGQDWSIEDVVGAELVEEVVLVPYLEGKSTTRLIERIGEANEKR